MLDVRQLLESLSHHSQGIIPDHLWEEFNSQGWRNDVHTVKRLYMKESKFVHHLRAMLKQSPTDARCSTLIDPEDAAWLQLLWIGDGDRPNVRNSCLATSTWDGKRDPEERAPFNVGSHWGLEGSHFQICTQSQ